jgi:hypothetical protein
MTVRGPDHAFHAPDSADRLEAAKPWADLGRRRLLVAVALVLVCLLGAVIGVLIEAVRGSLTGAEESTALASTAVIAAVLSGLAIWTDRLLFKASRPAFALPGEPYDERQAALVAGASRSARKLDAVCVVLIAALAIIGLPASFLIGATAAVLALTLSGPQLVLAWTLDPAEFDFDGELDDVEDDA